MHWLFGLVGPVRCACCALSLLRFGSYNLQASAARLHLHTTLAILMKEMARDRKTECADYVNMQAPRSIRTSQRAPHLPSRQRNSACVNACSDSAFRTLELGICTTPRRPSARAHRTTSANRAPHRAEFHAAAPVPPRAPRRCELTLDGGRMR